MSQNYNNISYKSSQKKLLAYTVLTKKDEELILDMKTRLMNRVFINIIEDIYIFYKNNYSTSDLAEVYNVSTRQIQRILKEMGINKNVKVQSLTIPIESKSRKISKSSTEASSQFKDYFSLPDRLKEFLNYLSVIKGKSSNTVEAYKLDLTMLFRFLKLYRGLYPSNTNLDEIQVKDIDDVFIRAIKLPDLYGYLSFVEKHRGNSAYARARKVASIRSFFRYLYTKTKVLEENPASDLETPKIDKRNPVYLNLKESKKLLESIDDTFKHKNRNLCIITLFLNCGLRLSELCSIDVSRIKGDTLTVIGKGNKERTVYLNNACLRAISDYMADRNKQEVLDDHKDALFLSERKRRISKRTVEVIVEKYIRAASLDSNKYTPHKLRHTAATLMYKHGNVDIRSLQKILGHENIATTQIYTHVDDEKLREAVNSNPLNDIK